MKIKQLIEGGEEFWPVVGAEAIKFPDDSTLPEVIEEITSGIVSVTGVFSSVEYDPEHRVLNFYDSESEEPVDSLDVSDFVKDGMVDTVTIENNELVITFNTVSGKQPIRVPLSNLIDLSNYYTKQELNEIIETIDIQTIDSNDVDNMIDTIFPITE